MKIINAMELKAGVKKDAPSRMLSMTQPIQFLPRDEKNDTWAAWNMDWLEYQGLKQVRRNGRRIMKNFKLAKGIIDKTDYLVQDDNEYRDLMDVLTRQDPTALELKFYPLVPPIINTFCAEFAKRNTKISFCATDEFSVNERDEQKRMQIEQVLLADAEQQMLNSMIQQGLDPNDPQIQEQMQQQLTPENLKTLPEIHEFFSKTYRSQTEQWAMHQYHADVEYFRMNELEERNFRNSLIADREFWHFRMMEDDYDIEVWNPATTFYHKSPSVRYVSQGNWVGNIEMLTVADVIDKYGYLMTEDQMKALEAIYPVRSSAYALSGYQNDGSFYDATRDHAWNVNQPGLAYRQYTSMKDNSVFPGGDIVNWINSQSEDFIDMGSTFLLRCTTVYWKSQRKVGHLTRIKENGEILTDIVDEDYVVTDKPVYNNILVKNKNAETLMFGEHIDWIWINQTWGGVKIGPNHPSWWGMKNPGGINPIYMGINTNHIAPLRFQFKGDKTIYGCKLPVEGCVYSDYNTRSVSLVDLLKPYQVGYNLVNNQIADILIDELGTVIMLDQNALPQHSLGEDWGKNNYAKAYVAMKNFQILPLNTTIANTEGNIQNQAFQQLNLEQSQRLLSRVNLANYFKTQAYESIGVNQQRMGQEMGRQTATGVEQNLNASYAQTEMYFVQHADYLMPRVHQMRTDLAQFYNSTKPSVRLQYVTTKDERVNFEINGTDLMSREIGVTATTDSVTRALLEQFKQMAMTNNSNGATIYDLGYLLKADSEAEVTSVLKDIEEKASKAKQEDRAHEENMKQMELEAQVKEKELSLDREALEKEKDRRANILIAEIRAAGYSAAVDKNANGQGDFVDFMENERKSSEFQDAMGLERTKENNKKILNEDKQDIQREKIAIASKKADNDLKIAQTNKNRFDKKPAPKKK
jgi:hypothetical protein